MASIAVIRKSALRCYHLKSLSVCPTFHQSTCTVSNLPPSSSRKVIFTKCLTEQKSNKLPYITTVRWMNEEGNQKDDQNKQNNAEIPEEDESVDVKTSILENALDFVEVYGWSREALSNGAEAAGYAGAAEGMFQNGGSDLVLYFVKRCNSNFKLYLEAEAEKLSESQTKSDTTEFLKSAMEYRLRMIIPYIDVWAQAMPLLLNPTVMSSSMTELGNMIDEVWHKAGDRSSDSSWYAKRALLAKVYASTQLVMLTDQSPDFRDTWEFLHRRLDDMERMHTASQNIQHGIETFTQTVSAGLTALKNLSGFGDTRR